MRLITFCGIVFSAIVCHAGFPDFKAVTLDANIGKVCYAVTVADVDGDGKQDIVAVTEREVLWYQAPDWKKRTIISDQTETDNVCIAPHDIDGDGNVDFALAAGWTKKGTLQWLSRNDSLDDKWNVHFIGAELWTHRMRWADVLGTGKEQLTISPLNPSMERPGARLLVMPVPSNPKTDPWQPVVIDSIFHRMHNHWHPPGSKSSSRTLTASQEGVYIFTHATNGFEKRRISSGAAGPKPADQGAGEIKNGRTGSGDEFFATIEPMHGNSVVVYTNLDSDQPQRNVLYDKLKRGHALWISDIDGDGDDDLIVGHSDTQKNDDFEGPGVFVYESTADDGRSWKRHLIDDGGIATEDAIATDVTGDGKIDIIAGGRATHNLKLYVQQ